MFITTIGLIIGIVKVIKLLKNRYDNSNQFSDGKIKIISKNIGNKLVYALLAINIVVIAISFLTASKFSFIYSELIFFTSTLTFSYLINKIINIYSNKTKKCFNIDLLMFAWFFSYLIFFSAHLTKVDRYFTTMAPGFAFFVTLAIKQILDSFDSLDSLKIFNSSKNFNLFGILNKKLKKNIKFNKLNFSKNIDLIKNIIPIVIIIIFIISTIGYLTIDKHDPLVSDEREVVNWLKGHDPEFNTKVIWAERGPAFTWHLKKEILYVNWLNQPKDALNKKIPQPNVLSTQMIGNNTSYFISIHRETEIPEYTPVKVTKNVIVYERVI
jgi:hypothetical protein